MTDTTAPLTLAALIAQLGITIESEVTGIGTRIGIPDATSYRVTLTRKMRHANGAPAPGKPKTLTVPFHQGPGIQGPPTAERVLDCLLSDASILEFETDGTFDGWLKYSLELGAEIASAADYQTQKDGYRAVCKATAALRILLGASYLTAMESDR